MEKMIDWEFLRELIKKLAEIGKRERKIPPVFEVEAFLKYDELDEYDGKFTRREILARYLLVNAVLDQGPDIVGVRELLKEVTTSLYRQEIRIFHRPIDFFKKLDVSINEILNKHESIKKIRAKDWAKENNSSVEKYNLFFTQSMRGIVSTKQVLDYAIHRWGVPLCLPLLLEKDLEREGKFSPQPLIDYLESYPTAEIMAQQLKDNERYGLGSAIGDKACHLFAKWYLNGWTDISYELPFDSNAGRVLFRTGFLLELASLDEYEEWGVIQKEKGKGGVNYIRVTNIRGNKATKIIFDENFVKKYGVVMQRFFKERKRKVEIQRIPNVLIYELNEKGNNYSIADLDDGLIYVGTNYCYNHDSPNCKDCPINSMCRGYKEDNNLIKNYRT